MAENYKHLYEQTKKMLAMYQDEIVPGMRDQLEKRSSCERCRDSAEMLIAITNRVKDPNAKSKWLGGHLPARYCPFCGRKLRAEDG